MIDKIALDALYREAAGNGGNDDEDQDQGNSDDDDAEGEEDEDVGRGNEEGEQEDEDGEGEELGRGAKRKVLTKVDAKADAREALKLARKVKAEKKVRFCPFCRPGFQISSLVLTILSLVLLTGIDSNSRLNDRKRNLVIVDRILNLPKPLQTVHLITIHLENINPREKHLILPIPPTTMMMTIVVIGEDIHLLLIGKVVMVVVLVINLSTTTTTT